MRTSRSLLPPSWASSQKTFRTCVPTSVLSVSTWVSEGLPASGHPGRTPALSPDPASPAALPVSAVPATLPPPPRVAQARNLGSSWRLPFPLHLTSDSSANPVGSTFRLFPESSHFSPLRLPPPQSRPGLSQQLLNGLRGLPCPLVLLQPFPTPAAEGSRGAYEPETEPLMRCALVSHPTWNESSMKADGCPAPCQTSSPPLSPAHSTWCDSVCVRGGFPPQPCICCSCYLEHGEPPLISLVSSDAAASLRPSWVSPDRVQALLPLLSFLSVSPCHGALVAPLLLCLPCCTVNASRWPGPSPCPQGPTCAWGSGRLG